MQQQDHHSNHHQSLKIFAKRRFQKKDEIKVNKIKSKRKMSVINNWMEKRKESINWYGHYVHLTFGHIHRS